MVSGLSFFPTTANNNYIAIIRTFHLTKSKFPPSITKFIVEEEKKFVFAGRALDETDLQAAFQLPAPPERALQVQEYTHPNIKGNASSDAKDIVPTALVGLTDSVIDIRLGARLKKGGFYVVTVAVQTPVNPGAGGLEFWRLETRDWYNTQVLCYVFFGRSIF